MRAFGGTAVVLAAALAGCGGSPNAAASGAVSGTLAFRNRMTGTASSAQLDVAGKQTALPDLPVDSATSVEFTAPAGTPFVLRWRSRDGARTDTLGIAGTTATDAVEFALTDVGIIKVGTGAD